MLHTGYDEVIGVEWREEIVEWLAEMRFVQLIVYSSFLFNYFTFNSVVLLLWGVLDVSSYNNKVRFERFFLYRRYID